MVIKQSTYFLTIKCHVKQEHILYIYFNLSIIQRNLVP